MARKGRRTNSRGDIERSVRVGYCVSLLAVYMECGDRIARAYCGVNEDVAIEYGS